MKSAEWASVFSSLILQPSSFQNGARGEIRTHHKADLKSAASSNWATRAKMFDTL